MPAPRGLQTLTGSAFSPVPEACTLRAAVGVDFAALGRMAASPQENRMNFSLSIGPVVALIAGILILIIPRLLNYIIALYLIIIGILGLMGEPRGRIGADATDTPPAAVQRAQPAAAASVVDI